MFKGLAGRLASRARLGVELLRLLRSRRALWLVPLVLLLLAAGMLLLVASQPVTAPFVYTLF